VNGAIFVFVLRFFFLICIFTPCVQNTHASGTAPDIFYIRSDIKITNGQESENKLLMVPAQNDYRVTSFTPYTIRGISLLPEVTDAVSVAKQDALKHLLKTYGVKSIQNKSISKEGHIHDETILSFEGFIKIPYTVLQQTVNKDNHTFEIKLEVSFAPLAYPSAWTFQYYKKKLYDTLKNMLSVFE
jgi:hypothetical protein